MARKVVGAKLRSPASEKAMRFIRTLLAEESGRNPASPEQATYEGKQVLLLLDCLYFLMEDTDENNRLIQSLAVLTGVWIAERNGEIQRNRADSERYRFIR